MKQGKSKADALFTATKKKDEQFLIEKDEAKLERAKKGQRLKALRLESEASDREAKEK